MGYFAKDFLYIGSSPIAPLGVYRLMVWQKNKNTHNAYPLISKLISIVIVRVTSTANREVVGSNPTKDVLFRQFYIFITQSVECQCTLSPYLGYLKSISFFRYKPFMWDWLERME